MGKKYSFKIFLLVILLAVNTMVLQSSNYVIASTKTNVQQRLGNIDWRPYLRFGNALYPSYLIATAGIPDDDDDDTPHILGNPRSLLGIGIINPAANTSVRVEIKIDQLGVVGTFQDKLQEPNQAYLIFPKIPYPFDKLTKIKQTTPANVTFNLFVNGKAIGQQVETIEIHSINECVRGYKNSKGKYHDTRWMYAAYVNEQHPLIDQLLGEALDTKVVKAFNGYQKSKDQVYDQVFAIWYLFQRKGFNYSSITTTPTSGTGQKVKTQTVRFINESLRTAQANCVDGSVLFASMLRKIGIDPFLVVIPGHCFVGFYLDKEHSEKAFLETTLLGHNDLDKYPEKASEDSKKKTKQEVSYKTFNKALDAAEERYLKNKEGLDDPKDNEYLIIDIKKQRKRGILPIPSDEK
jgi:hypothetical protein